jgi:ADP-glucose pyrophosphorylase
MASKVSIATYMPTLLVQKAAKPCNGAVALKNREGRSVGRRTRLTRCVVDHGCRIPDDMVVGDDAVEDARRFLRTESGITLVTREMLAALV